MTKCSVRRRVEYAETDMAGIVHFCEFFKYLESAEHELFRQAGLSVVMQEDDQYVSWPRVSSSFDFQGPLRFEDEFDVTVWIERMGAKSVTYHGEITREGTVLASGRMTSVCCLIMEGGQVESVPIPDAIREKLTAFLAV